MDSIKGALQHAQDSAQSRVSDRCAYARQQDRTDPEEHPHPLSAALGMLVGVGIGSVIGAMVALAAL